MVVRKHTKKNEHVGVKVIAILEQHLQSFYSNHFNLFLLGSSLVIILWQWPLVLSSNSLLSGDFDYFTQAYEAIRKSVVVYHQFPWLNAWIGGGVPLYANPQIGVFSLQSLLVLVVGAPLGLKLSIVAYSLMGFWGMFYLLKHNLKVKILPALALSSIWVTNGFFVAHLVSHYSFALFLVFPLLLYLLINITKRHYWFYLGLALGLFILSAFHYAAFHGFLILGCVSAVMLVKNRLKARTYLLLYLKAGVVFLFLAGHRIYYTLQFAFDFPRVFSDQPNSLIVSLKSFIIPYDDKKWLYDLIKPGKITYTWDEHTVFIGYALSIVILVLFMCGIFVLFKSSGSKHRLNELVLRCRKYKTPLLFSILFVLCIAIAMGDFGTFSPYALLGKLPAFSGMRVPSRWLIWAVFVGLLFVGTSITHVKSQLFKSILVVFTIVGAIEVLAAGVGNDRFFYKPLIFREQDATFEQFEDFDRLNLPRDIANYKVRESYDRRGEIYSYEATLNNFGQSRGYEPIVDTYYAPTNRCGVVQGCQFVKSSNATVSYWSPNKIILARTGGGPIELNINPSNYWLVNGQRLYDSARTVEVQQNFIITDESKTITLEVKPRDPPTLLLRKLKSLF